VLPFFYLLLNSLERFLGCFGPEDILDYERLIRQGIEEEIARGVQAARLKLKKYFDKANMSPLYAIATGTFFYLQHFISEAKLI